MNEHEKRIAEMLSPAAKAARIATYTTEFITEKLAVNRRFARPLPNGDRSYAHNKPFREHFVREMLMQRAELRKRQAPTT